MCVLNITEFWVVDLCFWTAVIQRALNQSSVEINLTFRCLKRKKKEKSLLTFFPSLRSRYQGTTGVYLKFNLVDFDY